MRNRPIRRWTQISRIIQGKEDASTKEIVKLILSFKDVGIKMSLEREPCSLTKDLMIYSNMIIMKMRKRMLMTEVTSKTKTLHKMKSILQLKKVNDDFSSESTTDSISQISDFF